MSIDDGGGVLDRAHARGARRMVDREAGLDDIGANVGVAVGIRVQLEELLVIQLLPPGFDRV